MYNIKNIGHEFNKSIYDQDYILNAFNPSKVIVNGTEIYSARVDIASDNHNNDYDKKMMTSGFTKIFIKKDDKMIECLDIPGIDCRLINLKDRYFVAYSYVILPGRITETQNFIIILKLNDDNTIHSKEIFGILSDYDRAGKNYVFEFQTAENTETGCNIKGLFADLYTGKNGSFRFNISNDSLEKGNPKIQSMVEKAKIFTEDRYKRRFSYVKPSDFNGGIEEILTKFDNKNIFSKINIDDEIKLSGSSGVFYHNGERYILAHRKIVNKIAAYRNVTGTIKDSNVGDIYFYKDPIDSLNCIKTQNYDKYCGDDMKPFKLVKNGKEISLTLPQQYLFLRYLLGDDFKYVNVNGEFEQHQKFKDFIKLWIYSQIFKRGHHIGYVIYVNHLLKLDNEGYITSASRGFVFGNNSQTGINFVCGGDMTDTHLNVTYGIDDNQAFECAIPVEDLKMTGTITCDDLLFIDEKGVATFEDMFNNICKVKKNLYKFIIDTHNRTFDEKLIKIDFLGTYMNGLKDLKSVYQEDLNSIHSKGQAGGVISTSSPFIGSDTLVITPDRSQFLSVRRYDTETPYSEQPFMASVNMTYSKPSIVLYENLNADPRLHKRMTNYYRYKFLDEWIHNELKYILDYFKDKKLSDDKKIDILENKVMTKNKVYSVLVSFVHNTKTNWYDLHKNERYIIEAFSIAIRKELKKMNM